MTDLERTQEAFSDLREQRIDTMIATVVNVLAQYTFRVNCEADLQESITAILERHALAGVTVAREVRAERGRYDIELVEAPRSRPGDGPPLRLVLELKVKGSAAAVERQAQRYALTADVSAVVIVTTSLRLAAKLRSQPPELGGKRFRVIAVRTAI